MDEQHAMPYKRGIQMIESSKNRVFHISSANTSYVFRINRDGYLEHLYYGRKLRHPDEYLRVYKDKHLAAKGNSTAEDIMHRHVSQNDLMMEFSTEGRGDYRTPALRLSDGRTVDLRYTDYRAYPGIRRYKFSYLPQAIATERDCSSLEVVLTDSTEKIEVLLVYTVFENLDAIVRKTIVTNKDKKDKTLDGCASLQLDLPSGEYELVSLRGAWGRERKLSREKLSQGTRILESRKLNSGAEDNPAFALVSPRNEAIFSSLIYSGAHRESITETEYGRTHIIEGINPELFSWHLEPGETFESPEAVVVYSENGIDDASRRFRRFIENAIYRGMWKNRLRPLMLSTFARGNYSVGEEKVSALIRSIKGLGFDGLLIDDGWFAVRKNEDMSLGDWYVNPTKFPQGLKALGNEIHRAGLMFGLYFEPEVVSRKSNLFSKHPEWALHDPGRDKYASTHDDFVLDLTRADVQEWMINMLSEIIETAKVDYIKWEMHRLYSDVYLTGTECYDTGEFPHRYMMGLYKVLGVITRKYPNLYLETAAAGGGRFDIGMLSYSASIVLSENCDVFERLDNYEGTLMFYPQSAIKLRIAPSPNIYTDRITELETKFNLSAFSVLEYSLDTTSLKDYEAIALKQQVAFYLQYRQFLQFASLRTLERGKRDIFEASNSDKSTIMLSYAQKNAEVNAPSERLFIDDAEESFTYRFFARDHVQSELKDSIYPQELECYEADGDIIKWAGIALADKDSCGAYDTDMRKLTDFSSRLYIIKKKENN